MSTHDQPKRKPGRPRKLPLDEVRNTLLNAGMDLLVQEGLFDGLNSLRLDWAIASTRVPRNAAYDLFQNADNYRRKVLLHVVAAVPSGAGLGATLTLAEKILAERDDDLNSDDPHRIESARSDLIRQTTTYNFDLLDGSDQWRLFRAIVLAMQTSPSTDEEIHSAIAEAETNLVNLYEAFFEDMAAKLHLKRKPGATAKEFAMCAYALNDGLANRATQTYRRHGYQRDGGDWSLLGIGFEGLVYQFYDKTK